MIEVTAISSSEALSRDKSDFVGSIHDLLRHYARRKRHDVETIAGLQHACGDVGELFVQGLILRANRRGDLNGFLLRALPEIWWIEAVMDIPIMPYLARHIPEDTLENVLRAGLAMVAHYERCSPAHETSSADQALKQMLSADAEADEAEMERARVVAHGLAQCVIFAQQCVPTTTVRLIESLPANLFLGALGTQPDLLANTHWLCTLILRGGANAMALAAISLPNVKPEILETIRVPLMMAPERAMVRLAELHGLLSLSGNSDCDASQVLRSAFLARIWRGDEWSDQPWHRAFRGESLVASVLEELGATATPMAKDLLSNIPSLLDGAPKLLDSVLRESMTRCFAWVLLHEPEYVAPFRLAEAMIRERIRAGGLLAGRDSLRAYIMFLSETKNRLLGLSNTQGTVKNLDDRIALLHDAYPQTLPRYQTATHLQSYPSTPDSNLVPARNTWDTSEPTTPSRRFLALAALPFRFLLGTICGWLGLFRHRTIAWRLDGNVEFRLTRKFFGWTLNSTSITLQPEAARCRTDSVQGIHKTLGLWTAFLLIGWTVGAYVLLMPASPFSNPTPMIGMALILLGGCGYAGALLLSRSVTDGHAVIVDTPTGSMDVHFVASGE